MLIEELDTPALIIDLDVAESNLRRMADYCRTHHLDLRPHTKTHKMPDLARRQVELGAVGITVAKLGEAEVMSRAGLDDLLIAYPLLGETKMQRLRTLLEGCRRLSVALDSEEAVTWLRRAADGAEVDVLVEVDFGMGRCGLPPGAEPVKLARAIERTRGLRFKGLIFFPGHLLPDHEGSTRRVTELDAGLRAQMDLFRQEGLPVSCVSGGSTPLAFYSHRLAEVTEIRPGTYVFNDRDNVELGVCREENCAATILATVVSTTAVPGRAIIDAGSKTFSSDPLVVGTSGGYGIVKGYPGIRFEAMNEEHGYLKLSSNVSLKVGQILQIIPNHICATVNLHDVAFACRGREVLFELPIAARGKVR